AYISLRVAAIRKSTRKIEADIGYRSRPRTVSDSDHFISKEQASGVRVETALSGGSRILVRGEAGSGKTTLLRWLAVTAARGSFAGDLKSWNGVVPVLIKLRSYGSRPLPKPNELLDDAAGPLSSVVPANWIDRQLEAGRMLLMVDGVDELQPKDRQNVRI